MRPGAFEDLLCQLVGRKELSEIEECFDAHMGLVGRGIERELPQDIEIEGFGSFSVRHVEQVLEDGKAQHDGDGFVRRAMSFVVLVREFRLDFDQDRQDLVAKRSRPGFLQALSLGFRQEELGVEQGFLRGFLNKHGVSAVGESIMCNQQLSIPFPAHSVKRNMPFWLIFHGFRLFRLFTEAS